MAAPKYKMRDVVYLIESASLGELEAYRIGAMKQHSDGVWLYQIYIDQKPPAEQTVGDRIDLKHSLEMAYHESDLTDLCGALALAISNIQSRINRYDNLFQADCEVGGTGTGTEATGTAPVVPIPPQAGAPKFSIGQQVYIKASSNIGFMEVHTVTDIHRVPESSEFLYQLDLTTAKPTDRPIPGHTLYFKERELLNKCDALANILAALDRKMARLLSLKLAYCA